MSAVQIYSDGSCYPNPGGPGGWAFVLIRENGERVERSGHIPAPTTSNRAELTAAIEALSSLEVCSKVELWTDSQYLQKGATSWIHGWVRKNWRGVKNVDLWKQVATLGIIHQVTWHWVPGHQNKGTLNDRCDYLAERAREKA